MLDDFFIRAIVAGVGVALTAGPLGCFVVWRRMAYFGNALAHSALLGVALGFLLGINLMVGVAGICIAVTLLYLGLEQRRLLTSDALLGILAHGALAVGLIAIAFMDRLRVDLMGYLFGDVLAVGTADIYAVYGLLIATSLILWAIWSPLLSATIHEDLAAVEGTPVAAVRIMFMLMIALVIAIGMKIVGVLLIVSMLIIPAAAARRLSTTPEAMAIAAAAVGAIAVTAGLFSSLRYDLPSGPAIVAAATLIFAVLAVWPRRQARESRQA